MDSDSEGHRETLSRVGVLFLVSGFEPRGNGTTGQTPSPASQCVAFFRNLILIAVAS
jgi:hypothetical protein